MDSNNPQSNNETVDLFNSESKRLENTISQFVDNSEELAIPKIIEVYYQVINIKSLIKLLRTNFEEKKTTKESETILFRIQEVEKFIDEKFDRDLHLLIMSKLKKVIEKTMKRLKDTTSNHKEKSKEELEIHAKMYESLRQSMSTKEFVEQYHKELSNSTIEL
ncbi:MAG: hypothetical protein OEL77_07720 [Nitrosopumilus sp.]|nr:hypothetical protein [Nitrosopumilus sp.]MDH3385883.1 hypothetical protein [Nitrosopumilus sp.]